MRELFTRNQDDAMTPGYLRLETQRVLGSGHLPIGRTYPRAHLFPDFYPFRGLRKWVEWRTSAPICIPFKKRFHSMGVLGATGKGKSVAYIVPGLVLGALETNASILAVDVKAPQLLRLLSGVYHRAGKPLLYIDPWLPQESLAIEPLWDASNEQKNLLVDAIVHYTLEIGATTANDSTAYFRDAATRLFRGLCDLAQLCWPRRCCTLPCLQQLVAGGAPAIQAALLSARRLLPSVAETIEAARIVVEAPADALRGPARDPELDTALDVIDRSGHVIVGLVRRMRRYVDHHRSGTVDDALRVRMERAFAVRLGDEHRARVAAVAAVLASQGTFFGDAEETRASTVSTLANKLGWFRDPNVARVFSEPDMTMDVLTEKPCTVLLGAPMDQLRAGSLFVSSLLINLAVNGIFRRGRAIQRGDRVSSHGVFVYGDEAVQLQIQSLPQLIPLLRGFFAGAVLAYQDRGQLTHVYGANATTIESNLVHQVLFGGAHGDTCEFHAKQLGTVPIVRRSTSRAPGQAASVSESTETVPLMTASEIKGMRLNGRVMPGMALSVGSDTPAFPIWPIPYYADPVIRSLLGLRRRLVRRDWRFWLAEEVWEPSRPAQPIFVRGAAPADPATPADATPATARPIALPDGADDPYRLTVTFLLDDGRSRATARDLQVPRLDFAAIGAETPPAQPMSAADQLLGADAPGEDDLPWPT